MEPIIYRNFLENSNDRDDATSPASLLPRPRSAWLVVTPASSVSLSPGPLITVKQ